MKNEIKEDSEGCVEVTLTFGIVDVQRVFPKMGYHEAEEILLAIGTGETGRALFFKWMRKLTKEKRHAQD